MYLSVYFCLPMTEPIRTQLVYVLCLAFLVFLFLGINQNETVAMASSCLEDAMN